MYRDLGSRSILEEGCNTIKKRLLVVSGHDTEVMMDLLEGELVGEGTSGVDAIHRDLAVRNRNQEVHLLSFQVIRLCHELVDAHAEVDRQLGVLKRQMARMNNNISCLANRPAKHLRITPVAMSAPIICDEEVAESAALLSPVAPIFAAKLSGCPRFLHDLWLEYEFGFSRRKAAKDFTEKERGANKYRYFRRNVFWMKVSKMIRMGFTAEHACDNIYIQFMDAMIHDKKDGGHPELRVIND